LLVILSFFDREPVLARVCVVQSLRGGTGVLRRREEILARLAGVLDEGRRGEGTSRGGGVTELTAEGLVGAALAIVYARLQREKGTPPLVLCGLTGELMSMIVLPYLGVAAARRELSRSTPAVVVAPVSGQGESSVLAPLNGDPLAGVPMRLTYRTALVLGCIAEQPGASNRVIGDRAGVIDQGQISKLLARLRRLGLVENSGEGHTKGEPNAWSLTVLGRRVSEQISVNALARDGAA
jgi:DNA-binding MarR family transcriptional regulator